MTVPRAHRTPDVLVLLPILATLAPRSAPAQMAARTPTMSATAQPTTTGTSSIATVGRVTRLRDGTLRQVVTLRGVAGAALPEGVTARPLYHGPVTPVPAGYGRYCSIVYDGGAWTFGVLPGATSDPCAQLRRDAPGGTIARAGLWHTQGENNVMARCGNDLRLYRARGGAAPRLAYDEAQGKRNCVFVISPAKLPIFALPYGKTTGTQASANDDVSVSRGHDFNVYNVPTDVTMFGRTPAAGTTTAIWVDRLGRQRDYSKTEGGRTWRVDGEAAYDLPMPAGKPLHAVAAGIVRGARWRDVQAFGCGTDAQGEIYVEHQVGDGEYAERFVSYYAHGSRHDVSAGATVTRGQKIGEVGNTGCSGGDHLHLGVMRTTNLSGRRWHAFRLTDDGYGVNGIPGIIDPHGWAAPQHIDPWAWMALGDRADPVLGTTVRDPGAFSIDLWIGARPPSEWK